MTSMAHQCGTATNWSDSGSQYPSLPSYLALTSGSTQGISTDGNPADFPTVTADNIFRQVRTAGLTERSYEEDMPTNCAQTSAGLYAVRHNPQAYYAGGDDRADCNANNVPMGTTTSGNLSADLANNSLPAFSFLTPNLCNDMHDCTDPSTGDAWLSKWLPVMLSSQVYQAGRTAIFVTFDEESPVPNFEIAPSVVPGTAVTAPLNHYTLLRTTEEMLGIPNYLLNAASAPDLRGPLNL